MGTLLTRGVVLSALLFALTPCGPAAAQARHAIPVTKCPLETMTGTESFSAPATVSVSVDAAVAQRVSYYTQGSVGAFAPRGWHCYGHSGTGAASLFVVPAANDPFGTNQRGQIGVTAMDLFGYGGHYVDVLATGAPLFANVRAVAASSGKNVRTQPARGERVTTLSPNLVNFCDAVGAPGTGAGSGGPYASCGVVRANWNGTAKQSKSSPLVPDLSITSITLQAKDQPLALALLNLNTAGK